eukprot:8412267-Pyramimonas_sp.AAC.1
MRVRLLNRELGTRSAVRARFAKILYCSERCWFSALNSGCGEAAGLVLAGVDSQTSDASACRIQ